MKIDLPKTSTAIKALLVYQIGCGYCMWGHNWIYSDIGISHALVWPNGQTTYTPCFSSAYLMTDYKKFPFKGGENAFI